MHASTCSVSAGSSGGHGVVGALELLLISAIGAGGARGDDTQEGDGWLRECTDMLMDVSGGGAALGVA
jgi:hypothetical protein